MIIEKLMLDKNMVKYKIRIDHQRLWSGPVIELFFLFDGRVFRFQLRNMELSVPKERVLSPSLSPVYVDR